jgi:phosphopantothenate---cysteine ligase (CTP)
MRLLVTAGNTLVPIDRVRGLTNVFTGKTGARIAVEGYRRGHDVVLLTSHPDVVAPLGGPTVGSCQRWQVQTFRTFDDLQAMMPTALAEAPRIEAVIHCAAVSDYLAGGIYSPAGETSFDAALGRWQSTGPMPPTLIDRAAGKVKSDEPELWLRLVRAPKLIDQVRTTWRFSGVLVKFKLEVGRGDDDLLAIAERSRRHSSADLMVANTLEGADSWAFVGPIQGRYERVDRPQLAARLLDEVEQLHGERVHG